MKRKRDIRSIESTVFFSTFLIHLIGVSFPAEAHEQEHESPPTVLSRQHLNCVHMYVFMCVFIVSPPLPPAQPALCTSVSSVEAEIDKLTLKALCLRSLLE